MGIYGSLLPASSIPSGLRVAIYGSGDFGRDVKEMLEGRGENTVEFFIDSYTGGEKHGLHVYALPELSQHLEKIDVVVIASYWWFDIEKSLKGLGVENYVIIGNDDVGGITYNEKEYSEIKSRIERVAEALATARDRELYVSLARCRQAESLRLMQACLKGMDNLIAQNSRQYLDYLDFSVMSVIIEGGVFDGQNTRDFLELTGGDVQIHGFDLFAADTEMCSEVVSDQRVHWHKKALWHEADELAFHNCRGGGHIVNSSNECVEMIEAVSIDAFVAKNGIDRIDFLKLDVEGAEFNVLRGASATLEKSRPQLAISIYHSKNDFIEIPELLVETLDDYVHRIGHYSSTINETIWYAIPKELYEQNENTNNVAKG